MGAYGFKKQFVPFILDGSKTHTIRAKRKRPDKPGSTFHGFYAMRTKQCKKLIEAPVLHVQEIRIERARVWIDGEELDGLEKDILAWRDGFREPMPPNVFAGKFDPVNLTNCGAVRGCFDLMLSFWVRTEGSTDFTGDMIHWDFRRRLMLGQEAGHSLRDSLQRLVKNA